MCQGPPERAAWDPESQPGGEPPAKKHPYFYKDEKEASAYLMLQICSLEYKKTVREMVIQVETCMLNSEIANRYEFCLSFLLASCDLVKVQVLATQSCLTLYNPMDCGPLGSSVQARTLEWVAIPFSRGAS